MVLSDANAAFSLPPDEARQEIIWVDDFSDAEANQFLDHANFLAGKTEKRNEIFARIGTRPAVLAKMLDEGNLHFLTAGEANVDAFVEDLVVRARSTLKTLLSLKFSQNPDTAVNFMAIHEALLKTPTGVPAETFEDDGATGIPKNVCVYLRDFHAFLYHYPSMQYRYAGKEYESAARQL
jgi:archaellum biogenesis ATPase FlaH